MEFLQQLRNCFRPTRAQCNDAGLEAGFDPMYLLFLYRAVDDEYEVHNQPRKHKVPGFEHFFNSVLMVTTNPEMIRGFRFELSMPLSEYFTFSHAWTLPNSGATEVNPMAPMMPPTAQKSGYTFTTQLVQDIRGQ